MCNSQEEISTEEQPMPLILCVFMTAVGRLTAAHHRATWLADLTFENLQKML